ncbi:putative Asl1-like glycosyl hydrolase catalytic domain-containing protein [Seiridium unicorne]|uniref:Asl1-like glycosyl hydrolase catalytic domain-containing protein n=1 Tax=Seiridium unicorne TaxID=138068 RepID=A0ABR2UXT8_9PEZI
MKPISALLLTSSLLLSQTTAESNATSKRGIAYIVGGHSADYNLLLSSKSPLNWYYTWTPRTAPQEMFSGDQADIVEFVPTIHNNTKLDADLDALKDAPDSSKYLFTFNEPDGTFETGGSELSPQDAARDYIAKIVPLRSRFKISHPTTTGSTRGFQWLQDFNAACWAIDPKNGCPTDFVVVHWYGDFLGMTSWIGQLAAWYKDSKVGLQGDLEMWVTELGVPGAPMDANYAVMSQTLPYLDTLDFVERYAWFGIFRPDGANNWTGAGLSLFENDGGLSTLGDLYVGGEANGFSVGEKGQEYNGTADKGSGNGTDTGSGNGTDTSGGGGNDTSTGNNTGSGEGGSGSDNGNGAQSITTITWVFWICAIATGIWIT